MTIHHATIKKATENSATITEQDLGNGLAYRVVDDSNKKLTMTATAPAKQVLAAFLLSRTFHYEYPALSIGFEADSGEWVVTYEEGPDGDEAGAEHELIRSADVPALADVLEACDAAGFDPELGADDAEEKPTGSIVPVKYKQEYQEHGGHCGDWLANKLAFLTPKKGQFNVEGFEKVLAENGVPLNDAWATSRSKGWQGRFRMTGRIKLSRAVAVNNELKLGGKTHTPPKEWRARFLPKQKAKKEEAA